MLKVQFQYVSS